MATQYKFSRGFYRYQVQDNGFQGEMRPFKLYNNLTFTESIMILGYKE